MHVGGYLSALKSNCSFGTKKLKTETEFDTLIALHSTVKFRYRQCRPSIPGSRSARFGYWHFGRAGLKQVREVPISALQGEYSESWRKLIVAL